MTINSLSKTLIFLIILLVFTGKDSAEFAKEKTQFKEAPAFFNSPYCYEIFSEENYECNGQVVNIAMTLDKTYLRGSMAAIFSIFKHSTCPENIYFHFIAALKKQEEEEEDDFQTTISSSFPYIRYAIYRFDEEIVRGRISTSVREALDRPLNYARSYLADFLPDCVRRVIYLDSDLILADDITVFFWTPIRPELALAAPEYCNANFSGYFTQAFWSNPILSLEFAGRRACYFNTGVMVVDLKKWRERDYRERIEEWMDLQKRVRIYELGSLPPFLLVFAGKIEPVDHRWNQHGLGGDNYEGRCRNLHPGQVSLIHWSGRGKPWVRLDEKRPCPVDALWAPYDLLDKKKFSWEF